MPRARVRPENRQRAYKACTSCKALKKRCDSQKPCSMCVRRGCAQTCTYQPSSGPSHSLLIHPAAAGPTSGQDSTDAGCMNHAGALENESGISPNTSLLAENETLENSTFQGPQPRMLWNAKGERVYVGGSATLSFLPFVRRMVRQRLGPSPFSENDRRHHMLEVDTAVVLDELPEESALDKEELLDTYFAVTNGILFLYTREEMAKMIEDVVISTDINHDVIAAVYLAVAIGSQCRGPSPADRTRATQYFDQAQRYAFEGMLQDPSLDMIQTFLLMAFYQLGACHRNSAFMYIGVASRAAFAIGLHNVEAETQTSSGSITKRLRVWKSLRILDLLVATVLGRPCNSSLPGKSPLTCTVTRQMQDSPSTLAFEATYNVCLFIADYMQDSGRDASPNSDRAEILLHNLRQWTASLPSGMRSSKDVARSMNLEDRAIVIGRVHYACVYYFTILLVTRPALIFYFSSKIALDRNIGGNMPESEAASKTATLAQACLNSAEFLVGMCHDAWQSGILLANMCLLKAWVFAADLYVGFVIFAEGNTTSEYDITFEKARDILCGLAKCSPQAAHYYEILSDFYNEIQKHRCNITHARRKASSAFVDEIFSLKHGICNPESQYGTPSSAHSDNDLVANIPLHASVESRIGVPDTLVEHELMFNMADWNDFAMELPDGLFEDLGCLDLPPY